ncbi:hypothetical protein NLG97_g2434 [Lecanicillium saksenae]|uniref:Uncharacterized protein n=1 Tax=Lecanicillium saksenae TaxID=468837 RepID=A0ACC1R4Z2_9HYPO|nr:hypothetical protein NLG97_g2434 [Lecanicillium saksenae]
MEAAVTFFQAIGFTKNSHWKLPDISMFRFPGRSSNVSLVLLEKSRYTNFIRPGTKVVDSRTSTESIIAIVVDTKEEVDAIFNKAVAAGAKPNPFIKENNGEAWGLYSRSFEDVDGHIWEASTDLPGHVLWECTAFQSAQGASD